MKTKQELYDLYQANATMADWERYDFVDPPYCWAASITLEVDGYLFEGDGCITCGERDDINELWCTTPEGEKIQII